MEIFRREKGLPDPKEEKGEKTSLLKDVSGSILNDSVLTVDNVLGQSSITADIYNERPGTGKADAEDHHNDLDGACGDDAGDNRKALSGGDGQKDVSEDDRQGVSDSSQNRNAEGGNAEEKPEEQSAVKNAERDDSAKPADNGSPVGRFSNGRLE